MTKELQLKLKLYEELQNALDWARGDEETRLLEKLEILEGELIELARKEGYR